MSKMKFIFKVLPLFFLFLCVRVECAELFNSGFKTLGIWQESTGLRMDINLWYPTMRQENNLNVMPWQIKGAMNAKPAVGKFPLIIIAHDTPANRFSYHYLARWFARHGYIVAAPTHTRDSMDNMEDLFSWSQLETRAKEITKCIDIVVNEKDITDFVDYSQIGYIGFGVGGTVGLLLGGVNPNCTTWKSYCEKAGENDTYCRRETRKKINELCVNLNKKSSLTNNKIKALAIIAPAYGMLFDNKSFQEFLLPIILVGTGKDKINRTDLHSESLARILGGRAKYLDLTNADASALMSECPPSLIVELPELCLSINPEEKEKLQNELENSLLAFFSQYFTVDLPTPEKK